MARMIIFNLPEDPALVAAIGRVAVRHGHLEYTLRMTVKSMRGLKIPEALVATQWWGASKLRKKILKGARSRFGAGEHLTKLEDILDRAAKLSEKRNRYIHGVYAKELDGEPVFRHDLGRFGPLPSAAELETLANEIAQLTNEINDARLNGWLKQAIAAA